MRSRITFFLAVLFSVAAFAQRSSAAFVATFFDFDVNATPTQPISDSIFHFSTTSNPNGTIDTGNFPANVATDTQNVVANNGNILTLAPTWSWFGLYTITEQGFPTQYGIAVALTTTAYENLGGTTFDQLFDTNVDAAYNDGQTHTEADLINQFQNNGVADAAFTTGISDTPAAEIPFGQAGPIVLFSAGTLGGTIEANVTVVPEPASLALLAAAAIGLSMRRRRVSQS